MSPADDHPVFDLPELRDRTGVFEDRGEAGQVLARMLADYRGGEATVLAIPAGGVPVAAEIAAALGLPLDVAVVSKITPPWNSEVGYGAVAFDGTVRLNDRMVWQLGIGQGEAQRGIAATTRKVRRRAAAFRGDRAMPDLSGRTAVLVDDGLASGFTMTVAIEAVRRAGIEQGAAAGPGRVVVAVPTAHAESMAAVAKAADALYCANVRRGWSYAVADAYRRWTDVSEADAARRLREFADER